MLYIVQFTDDPAKSHVRTQQMAAHIEFLDRMRERVLVPGSLREIPTDRPLGGLWIVEAESEEAVREIFAADPFWVNGLRAGVDIYRWNKAFPDRRVEI